MWTAVTLTLDGVLIALGVATFVAAWRLLGPRLGYQLTFTAVGLVLLSNAHLLETALGVVDFEGEGAPEVLHRLLVMIGFVWLMVGLSYIARDLFDRHARLAAQAEEARNEREKTQAVMNHMAEGVLVVDARGRVVSSNRALELALGVEPGGLQGWLVSALLTRFVNGDAYGYQPSDADVGHTIELAAGSGEQPLWLAASVSSVAGDTRMPSGHVLVLRDVSRLRHLERMKSDFVELVSHELRRPVTNLVLTAELCRAEVAGLADDHPLRQIADVLDAESDRARTLVEEILMAARFEGGQLTFELTAVQIGDLLRDVIARANVDHGARRDIQLDARDEFVHADAFALRLVIHNLVDNALKYSPATEPVHVRVTRGRDSACIMVSDRGAGIAPGQLERVFDRFYRLDNDDSRTTYGFGLGLYIAKHVAQAMGGQLTVESAVGQGSTFSLELPLAGPSAIEGSVACASAS